MNDLISIIVPVHNGEAYIKRCIDSIAAASKKLGGEGGRTEIIIINDGSTDDTAEVCKRLCDNAFKAVTADQSNEADKCSDDVDVTDIRIISMNDEGVSAARNRGIDEARGEYICFVDADDVIAPDMLERLYKSLTENNAIFAGCGFYEWSSKEELSKHNPCASGSAYNCGVKLYSSESYLKDEIAKGNSRCWSKLYRLSFIKENNIRFKEGLTIGEDMLFLIRLVSKLKGYDRNEQGEDTGDIMRDEYTNDKDIVELKDYRGYGYYKNPEGAINRKFNPRYMDQILCWELMLEELDNPDIWKNLVVAIMLTASKLALLSAAERKVNYEYIEICHDKLAAVLGSAEGEKAYKLLDRSYKIKTRIFLKQPELYMRLYHSYKGM